MSNSIPRLCAKACASALLPSDENGPGMETPDTFSAPSASTAIDATTAESIPPLRPTSAFLKAAFANVILRPGDQRAVGVRDFFLRLLVLLAFAGDGIEKDQILFEGQACAATFPSAVNAMLAPSKIRLSSPPT